MTFLSATIALRTFKPDLLSVRGTVLLDGKPSLYLSESYRTMIPDFDLAKHAAKILEARFFLTRKDGE